MNDARHIIKALKDNCNPDYLLKLQHFGVDTKYALGTPLPIIREIAKKHKKRHDLALKLWGTQIHEAKILATIIDDPEAVTKTQSDNWVASLYSWDLCDQLCINLLNKTPFAIDLAYKYSKKKNEFEKRAGFVIIAAYSVHNKQANDKVFIDFLQTIVEQSTDERNYIKKGVNWALRAIGKRNESLNRYAIQVADHLLMTDNTTANWIAKHALREFEIKKNANSQQR